MLTLSVACMVLVAAFAFTSVNPPVNVSETFKSEHKNVAEVNWKSSGNTYTASFKNAGVKTTAVYSKAGQLLLTRSALKPAELPAGIRSAFATGFKGQEIRESSLMTEAGDAKKYVLESKKLKAVYDEHGKFLKKEGRSEKEDEGDDEEDDD